VSDQNVPVRMAKLVVRLRDPHGAEWLMAAEGMPVMMNAADENDRLDFWSFEDQPGQLRVVDVIVVVDD
jgi:hypothetical protein